MGPHLSVRAFEPADADAVTRLLHAAYGEHLEAGLNFTAATQSVETTRRRSRGAGSRVVVHGDEVVATATVSVPPSHGLQRLTPVAAEPGMAWLNQFAVSPDHRGEGIASALFAHSVEWARTQGMTALGIDTAAPADGLIALYEHWGFTHRDRVRWDGKTYDSVVMVRPL